ncbi:mediator of DNA damage checkpoint protein 1 isoform X2 [Gasterosteus aculeatus]
MSMFIFFYCVSTENSVRGMDATQILSDSILESDEEENKGEIENKRGRPLAKLWVLKNEHIPETEMPLFLGDNVLGRDPSTCTVPLPAPSISKQHATICISVHRRRGRHNEAEMEALIWDRGSMNGTRKGHLKLTPNVRYALSEGDGLVVADVPCQYVSCTVDSSEGDTTASVGKHSGANAESPDGSGEEGSDTSTGSKRCVNGDTEAGVLLSDQEDSGKTSVLTSCLSFEQTPTHPQGTLVPESDSDSDDSRGDGRRKALGPVCSTFLSPTNKIVPESEDESPITPPSLAKNRPHTHVGFSKEDHAVEMGQQQLKNENTLGVNMDNNNEEEEEERAALAGSNPEESEHHVSGKQESNVSLTGENELPKSSATFLTDAIPVLDMDSDTDVEGEEDRVASASPVTLNANQQAVHFYIDSDTDVDEDVQKPLPSSADRTKPLHVISVVQPEGITFDSDTDVDEDAVSEAAIATAPLQSTDAVVSSPSMQGNNFHLGSDTDIEEEEEENQCGKNSVCFKIDETPTRLDIHPTGLESTLDSETGDGAFPAPAIRELSVVSAVAESVVTADLGAVLGFLSDSDTDVEDDSSLLTPAVASNWSTNPSIMSEALQSDSGADRDVDESSGCPAGDGVDPADLRVDSDTDVEDEEKAGENQIPSLRRENTPGLLVPLQQNCSTPVQSSGRELEDMETQAFPIAAFGRLRPISLSPCSAGPEDNLCVVAETQSFLLPTRDCQGSTSKVHNKDPIQSSVSETCKQSIRGEAFQLGLSQSSHLEGQAQALATESTQAFVSAVEGVNLEDTQAYGDRASSDNDSNLQAHEDDQEPARCSEKSAIEGHVDFALEATQAFISEPDRDSEVETDEDERENTAAAETQPFHIFTSSTSIALAETQPMFNMEMEEEEEEEEESLDHTNPIPFVLQVKSSSQHVTEEKEEQVEAAQPVAETQPMRVSEDEEIDGEELFPQKTNAKQPRLEEQTQTLAKFELSLVDTQPMHTGPAEARPVATSGKEDGDVGDSLPGPRKRKAKQLQTQTPANSELSTGETQPVETCEDSESDEEDSAPGPRKRRAKPLQLEDEAQPLASSAVVETELSATCVSEQRNDGDTPPGPRKRKAKSLPLEEEETHPLTASEVSAVEAQPVAAGEERESDDEELIPGPRKRRAKPIQGEGSTQETKTVTPPPRGRGRQNEAGTSGTTVGGRRTTRARRREEEEQAECSEPPKRRTSRATKALPSTTPTVRRGKARLDEEEGVKEEEIEQDKQARGKSFMMHPKDSREDEETLETGRKNIDNDNLKKPKGREEQYQLEMERKVKEERERLQAEDAEKLRREQERAEKERIERERKEEDEKKIADRAQKEREEQLEQERKEKEENERHEKAAREEKERIEKEREKEEEERLEREKAAREEKERTEKVRKEDEDKVRLECKKAEREEKERKEEEEKERLKTAKRELEERLERERNEQEKEAKEKQTKAQQGNKKDKNSPKTTPTARRTARRTPGGQQDPTTSASDDVPARRTRSRSNSSNSVSSERSVSSVSTQGSSGRGRGAKRQAAVARSSTRRTVAAEPTQRDIYALSPQGVLSRSNAEISSGSPSSHSRGRGGRQRGRGRKTESDSVPPADKQSGRNVALEPTTRGRRSRTAEGTSNEVPPEEEKEEAPSRPAATVRGRQRADANQPKPADEKSPSSQMSARKDSPLPKRNVLGRGQKAVKGETVEVPVAPAVSDGEEAKEKTKGRKRESKANAEEDSSLSSKMSEAQTIEAAQVQVMRRGRASSAQAKKKAKDSSAESEVKEESEEMEEGTVRRRVRGRPSMVQKLKKEKQEERNLDPHVEASEPQTPSSSASRKRQALTDSSPVAKTPRSSSASPAAGGQLRAARQAYKVLFTGVVDEEGERVLARLGGSMAEGVADMNCLVTDKVRRTVKFLCALAKGVPIVTTHWLEKSGKAGSFLSPNAFVVKDPEQEKKFSFCLQDSLGIASSQRLLQGYQIHVTKSVKPEPVHMKDIISCSGATFLPKMPSSHKPKTVVISCEEDLPLCGTALSESVPVVTAEFILTGILRQKVDLQTHKLSVPANTPQPAGGRGRSRKKT